ncbi:hypothetical protein PV08_08584 [Exophiala spinifera]|uniref:Mitochondrial thiamine pyrophosphate carrier 1 n=1 Tax=Exophiala spinifera TaxID=91928 RepID=A0A0D1YE76_9EURO|nr:uncharacterized protein PV08_08584 [Exophiala spinifera]KIW13396.1 hypothetical protein PV08_08584 [Exophiala spinifera]
MAAMASPPASIPPLTVPKPSVTLPSANKRKQIHPAVSLLAGSVAGGIEAAVTYPFEFAKTQAQLKGSHGSTRNPLLAIAQTARSEGVGAIYTGCSTLILGTMLKAGVRFLSFDFVRNLFADDQGRLSASRGVLAGLTAGCVESIVAVTPTERLKTALIDDAKGQKRFKGGANAFATIIREQGLSGLYRGLVPTVMKQSATSAVRMGSYNVLREYGKQKNLPNNSLVTFATGAIAGTVTVYMTQPLDTIKTRSQGVARMSTMNAVRDVFVTSGVRGFWRGSTMRLGRLVFSGGIVFMVYENVVSMLSPAREAA